jgi:hypothetical protein
MLRVFLDYPNPTIKWHADPECTFFHRPETPGHRLVTIYRSTISKELELFATNSYRFGAEAELNSLWLEVDFEDRSFELAVARHIRRLLMKHYTPFARARLTKHCG